MPISSRRRLALLVGAAQCAVLARCSSNAAGSGGGVYGGRHSYSLSTFSPSGDLDQVVRAMRASMLGTPIVALAIPPSEEGEASDMSKPKSDDAPPSINPLPARGGIYLSLPLRFLSTSPFLVDDGTPRIVHPTSSICVAHTGVGADGRALCDVAVKLALDYRYVYGEEITVEELLEGLAEKVQEMTMRAGSRPYGCALLVGCLGGEDGSDGPAMYRVDPSGAVVLLGSNDSRQNETTTTKYAGRRGSVAFLGNWDPLRQKKDAIRNQLGTRPFATEDEVQDALADAAKQTFQEEVVQITEQSASPSGEKSPHRPILFASLTHERGLQISRIVGQE
ncbi:hypothetical protein ACHAXT_006223 [Thalassiosira profunda]